MTTVNGTCDSQFVAVKELLQSKISADEELGASIVVNFKGKNVVDIWGGYADKDKTKPWVENTITNVWSSSKTVVSLAALVLIERGLLDPYEKVSKYWPEFAVNGKEDVQVRHFLSHTSGVSGWEGPITVEEICDTEKSTARLAAQAPWWKPGSASGYHSITMGHLIGELVQRVTNKPLARFIAEELAAPLNADFQLGASESDWHRCAEIIPPPTDPTDWKPEGPASDTPETDTTSIYARTLQNPSMDASTANKPFWRKAAVGAANGHTNARGIARLLSVISLGGTVDGVKLLSPSTIDLIFKPQIFGPDLVVSSKLRFGIGYGLNGQDTDTDWVPEGKICFWGGWGGSMAIIDVGRQLTITYMMNKMGSAGLGSGLAKQYIWEVYRALGVAIPGECA
jgi:CubicO group peptidase (beta-lactamase class C family)